VIRGGSWAIGPEPNSFRTNYGISARHDQIGFRCAHLP
jgi:formylglycine-generating enzyme required for sulfatase activity